MKIYTTHFNCNKPSNIQVNVPNYSDAKIGIDVEKNGEKIELGINDATLVDGEAVISADGVYNGYLTFPLATGNCSDDNSYTLSVNAGVTVIDEILSVAIASDAQTGKTFTSEISLSSMIGKELNANSIEIQKVFYEDYWMNGFC